MIIRLIIALALTTAGAAAQPDAGASTNRTQTNESQPLTPPQQARAFEQATERIRADCIQGRRIICGKIVKITADGLVVESGYTNLMRTPLNKKWLLPGTVQATRQGDLVEGSDPGAVCVGLVFLTALPKSRLAKPKLYDYVVIQGYPAGPYSYTSVGTIRRTVRRFAASLAAAIKINRAAAGIEPPKIASENK
ncbi:MAG: hypothetical protein ACLQVY_29335 [Limisphaerales bacterium]